MASPLAVTLGWIIIRGTSSGRSRAAFDLAVAAGSVTTLASRVTTRDAVLAPFVYRKVGPFMTVQGNGRRLRS